MARKRYKAEEIVAKLRQVDVLTSQGQSMAGAIRQIGVSEVTYYRWRQEFGGLKIEQIKRLKGKRCQRHIAFAIDAAIFRFSQIAWRDRLQQGLQYLLQSFAAVWARSPARRRPVTPRPSSAAAGNSTAAAD